MATLLRIQVNMLRDNGLPEDICTNTWHFYTEEADPVVGATSAVAQLEGFYEAVDSLLASYLNAEFVARAYDLTDNEPRVPIYEQVIETVLGTGTGLPSEVAICLSYRATLESGTNPARRRGRIFLGPLDQEVGGAAGGDYMVSPSTQEQIAEAATGLCDAGVSGDTFWAVFSPTIAGASPWSLSELEAASQRVTAGFVDNAFDTIRSRGVRPTERELWTVTLP
jgi:hypothetical protein